MNARSLGVAVLVGLASVLASGCTDLYAVGWGANDAGQLGNGTFTDSPVAVPVGGVPEGSNVVDTKAGSNDSCAVTAERTAACWGELQYPEATKIKPDPAPIPRSGVLATSGVVKTVTGERESCAITDVGVVGCWSTAGVRQIVGFLAGKKVVEISVGRSHGCAVTSTGLVGCWGANAFGQLGDDSALDSTDPVAVNAFGVLKDREVVKVTSGDQHSCALTADGAIACWGSNDQGQLGRPGIEASSVPVAVDTSSDAVAFADVTAGGSHTCAVTTTGRAQCWGSNGRGQLGDDSRVSSDVPVSVNTAGALANTTVAGVTAGSQHSCALTVGSEATCWGANSSGQLGDGSTVDSSIPVSVVAADGTTVEPVITLDAGGTHTLAVVGAATGSQFMSMTPLRVIDTRLTQPDRPAGPLSSGTPLTVDLSAAVPAGATAVAYNITSTGQTASGLLTVTPTGASPGASTINWSGPQQTIANGYVSKLGADRALEVALSSTGTSHVVIDITGAFVPSDETGSSELTGADRRLYDSRVTGGPLAAGESRIIDTGSGDSTAATAAAINLTVTGTTGSGVFTAAALPSSTTSTINWSGPNQTVANAVITDVAADGTFTVTNNGTTAAHAVVDLTGVFAPPGAGGAQFYPMDPIRSYDSRATGPPMDATLACLVSHPIPVDATAVALNATVTGTEGTGYLAVTPPEGPVGQTSTVNWFRSPTTRANGGIIASDNAVTRTYVGGRYCTHFLTDVAGYFR